MNVGESRKGEWLSRHQRQTKQDREEKREKTIEKMENGKWNMGGKTTQDQKGPRRPPKGSKKGPEHRPKNAPRHNFILFVFPINKPDILLLPPSPLYRGPGPGHCTWYLLALLHDTLTTGSRYDPTASNNASGDRRVPFRHRRTVG